MSANQPCGCHDLTVGDAAIPSLAEFEQVLQAVSAASPAAAGELNELDLAGLETSLAALDDLPLDTGGEGIPELSDLVRLIERYPGLKITLSL
jgi:hypothetical protein